MLKATCKCMEESGAESVIAIKDGSFSFLKRWGWFEVMCHVSFGLVTGGAWIGLVLMYKIGDIVSPPYRCNKCDAVVKKDQFI